MTIVRFVIDTITYTIAAGTAVAGLVIFGSLLAQIIVTWGGLK